MPNHSLSDYMARTVGIGLVVTSAVLLFVYPSLPGLAVSTVNLGLVGMLLLSSHTLSDRKALEWERIALAAWLASSPWVIGVSEGGGVAWISVICATFIFAPAASFLSQPWAYGKAKPLGSFPMHGPAKKRHL